MYHCRLFLTILILTMLVTCKDNPGSISNRKKVSIEFENNTYDFGELYFGGNGTCEFVFKNEGKEPLILLNVRTTCGCTVPEWPDKPVKEGETGIIRVSYDTYRVGAFTKAITVYSNAANSPVRLFIKGRVKPKE
jgi:hypothetical protein